MCHISALDTGNVNVDNMLMSFLENASAEMQQNLLAAI